MQVIFKGYALVAKHGAFSFKVLENVEWDDAAEFIRENGWHLTANDITWDLSIQDDVIPVEPPAPYNTALTASQNEIMGIR